MSIFATPLPSGEPSTPGGVELAFWLWRLSCALTIVVGASVLVMGWLVQYAIDLDWFEELAYTFAFVELGIVVMTLGAGGFVITQMMEAGQRWARNILTAAGLTTLAALSFAPVTLLLAIGTVTVVALVGMYLPNSNAYFRRPFPAK